MAAKEQGSKAPRKGKKERKSAGEIKMSGLEK